MMFILFIIYLGDRQVSLYLISSIQCLFLGLVEFLKALDIRADEAARLSKHHAAPRKQRRDGTPDDTLPPSNAPKWTLSSEYRKG